MRRLTFPELLSAVLQPMTIEQIWPLVQVILIDIVLAGDNAIIVGLVAATVPSEQRSRVILAGIGAAAVLRIGFALVTVQLLQIIGLILAGGLLLLWVCWKLWRELRATGVADTRSADNSPPPKSVGQAIFQIMLADVSMSLDNVLAVAGAAQEHTQALIFGLVLSVALMAFAATLVARLLERHRWIAYLGLGVIFYVAVTMIWAGAQQVIATTIS